LGDDESGGGGSMMCWSPQERLLVSLLDFNTTINTLSSKDANGLSSEAMYL
jgi:hypothetical protein